MRVRKMRDVKLFPNSDSKVACFKILFFGLDFGSFTVLN